MDIVQTKPQDWIYVSYRTSMDSNEIGRLMGEAFGKLGQFIGQNGIVPAGSPFAVYHDYTESGMIMDVGFPVDATALAKASGDIKAGQTPSGKAIKVVHKGPYQTLRETYGKIEEQFKSEGTPMSSMSWEVYVTDPDTTPEAELLTEIYMKVD